MALDEQTMEVAASGTVGDEEWANVWHVIGGGSPTDAISDTDANLILDHFVDFYGDIKGQQATAYALTSIEIRQLHEVRLPIQRGVSTVVGTNSGAPLPLQASALLSLRTDLPGRSRRGRIYLAGFVEGANNTGARVEAATIAVLGAAVQELDADLQAMSPNSFRLAVYSRTLDNARGVATVLVPSLWAEQRRRVNKLNPVYSSFPL